jgi:hypothetical protein
MPGHIVSNTYRAHYTNVEAGLVTSVWTGRALMKFQNQSTIHDYSSQFCLKWMELMGPNLERIRQNARGATTEDLLDRVTVFRVGMEPAALEIIEAELTRRGVAKERILAHEDQRRAGGLIGDKVPRKCSFCDRPAVVRRWGRGRREMYGPALLVTWFVNPLLWLIHLLPWRPWAYYYCDEHAKTRWERVPKN